MAILKFKNPKYTGIDDEPKYITIPNIVNPIKEIFVGEAEPSGDEVLWINTTDSSIKYKNGGEWISISSDIDLSEYALKTEVEKKADKIKIEDGGSGTITKELQPNVYYEFGECSSLTITLAPEISGIYNEYMFEFISGEVATQLSLPKDIKWIKSDKGEVETPVIKVNTTYECSIVNNKAMIKGW